MTKVAHLNCTLVAVRDRLNRSSLDTTSNCNAPRTPDASVRVLARIDRFFKFAEFQTNYRTKVLAGMKGFWQSIRRFYPMQAFYKNR